LLRNSKRRFIRFPRIESLFGLKTTKQKTFKNWNGAPIFCWPQSFCSDKKFWQRKAGLPDGLFSNRKIPIWENFVVLRLQTVDIFYGHLEYFTDVWDIL
jgi:hypothetical protein